MYIAQLCIAANIYPEGQEPFQGWQRVDNTSPEHINNAQKVAETNTGEHEREASMKKVLNHREMHASMSQNVVRRAS